MRRRDHLRTASPAVLAVVLAMAPVPALAQAFQGTATPVLGGFNRVTGAGTETILVVDPLVTINWIPTDTASGGPPINFLPHTNAATFQSATGLAYTVLNRIIAADPSRAIALNGTVNSDAIGNVWFYAPGGLLLGGSASVNVGGLLLTANDPVGAAGGGDFINPANQFQLAAAAGSTAGVTIAAGARIASSSYMIAVAPRLTMAGDVTVGTSAALVMAEDVRFTLNGGLFDITANIGSAAGGTSTVSGSITGPGGNSGAGVFSRIYMMAVPRNDAMTLLITGGAQLGFDVASAADVDGNAIVLSGGHDIIANPFVSGTSQFADAPVAGSDAAATINVEAATLTSGLVARSKDTAQVVAATGAITAAGDIALFADGQALIGATGGQTLNAAGRLVADASTLVVGSLGLSRTAGLAEVAARGGGQVIAGGDIIAAAVGVGDFAGSPGQPGASGTGGTARILAEGTGSQVRGAGLIADASGRAGAVIDGDGGSGIGGTAELRFDAGTLVAVTGDIGVFANGSGDVGGDGRASGDALGGTATLALGDGVALDLGGGFLLASANADYGEGGFSSHLGGGTAQAGTALVRLGDGASLQAGLGNVSATAFGTPGTGRNNFIGGTATVRLDDAGGATALTLDTLGIFANGEGGTGVDGTVIDGGSGRGGSARLLVTGNGRLTASGPVTVAADGLGGDGADVSGGFIGIAGAGTGGAAVIDVAGDGLVLGDALSLSAKAIGGRGDVGGDAAGGTVRVEARGGLFAPTGPLLLDVAGLGGSGTAGSGGSGTGGTLQLVANGAGGIVRLPGATLAANGVGGAGTTAGAGSGGAVVLTASNGGLIDMTAALVITAQGTDGAGAPGTAGVVQLLALGGSTMTLASLDAQAIGTAPAGARSALVAGAGSSIAIAGDGLFAASGAIGLNDGGSITAGGTLRITTPGQILAGVAGPTPGVSGTVAATLLELQGDAGIDVATGTTGSADVVITSTAGSVRIGSIGATGSALIDGAGDVAIAGNSAVAGDIVITAGGAAALAGNLASPDIAITSADIAITPGIILGGAEGARILLAANAAATSMVVGGAGSGGSRVYRLADAEFAALRARSIRVEMPRGAMTVEALTLPAIAPAGRDDGIALFSAGPMRVTGPVRMAAAGAANRLSLVSEERIVVQGSGSILLGASEDTPAGELDISAPSIRIASDSLLAQIADGSLAGTARDNALNAPGSTGGPAGAPGGSIAAGSIRLAAETDLLIQNSGSRAVPAGFTAGSGGLIVSALGSGLLDLVINGRIARAAGGFATGADTLPLVQYAPDIAAMAASSTVNGCNIFGLCPARGPLQEAIITDLVSIRPLTPEAQRDRARLQASTPALPLQQIQTLFDFGPLFRDVDATDPATSTGNPALWGDPAAPASGGQP